MKGNDGGGLETAGDFVDCFVLGDLEDIEEACGVALG